MIIINTYNNNIFFDESSGDINECDFVVVIERNLSTSGKLK